MPPCAGYATATLLLATLGGNLEAGLPENRFAVPLISPRVRRNGQAAVLCELLAVAIADAEEPLQVIELLSALKQSVASEQGKGGKSTRKTSSTKRPARRRSA